MILKIITPESVVFKGEVDLVTLPGIEGIFTVLENHASMISLLTKGKLTYRISEEEYNVEVITGFTEIINNSVTVCLELI